MDDKDKKLRQRIWIALGVSVFLTIVMAVVAVQFVIKPKRAQIATVKADYDAKKTTANGLAAAYAKRQKALDKQQYVTGQLAFFRQRYRALYFGEIVGTAPAQIAARNVVWRRWMNEYASDYGLALRQELLGAANATNVVLKTDIKIGPPPKAPEEVAAPANGLFKPTGGPLKMSVTGSYANIMDFFVRINRSSILMMVDRDIKLSGYSPDITATFSLTPYLLAAGTGAPIQTSAASGAAPGASGDPGSSSSSGQSGASPSGSPSGP